MFLENRVSCLYVILFRTCHAITIAITTVFPEPVAIFAHNRSNCPPSEGICSPTFSFSGASTSQIRVSAASSWQKKNCRLANSSGSFQYVSNLFVIPVTPGYPASRHVLTRDRIWLTSGISMNSPGSSNAFESPDATTYPADRRPSTRLNKRCCRS